MIDWKTTDAELALITAIAERAVELSADFYTPLVKLDVEMDVTATHLNGCPLRLEDFLAADNFNFGHDIFGIQDHLDRETGELDGRFSPRFTNVAAMASA